MEITLIGNKSKFVASDIGPNPLTIDLVGIIWAIPHRVVTIEPIYSVMPLVVSIPPYFFIGYNV